MMMSGAPTTLERAAAPTIGRSIPTAVLPLSAIGVAAGLCVIALKSPLWLGIGLLLAVISPFFSTHLAAGSLVLLLGVSQLWRTPHVSDPRFYVLLAGLHLLYVLGSFARVMPWAGRIELAALVGPAKRYAMLQAISQGIAVVALSLLDETVARISGLSTLAALLLSLLALLFAMAVRRQSVNR